MASMALYSRWLCTHYYSGCIGIMGWHYVVMVSTIFFVLRESNRNESNSENPKNRIELILPNRNELFESN